MNLTVILGNGFDLRLGLKTSYVDFYNAFLAREQSTWNVNESEETELLNKHPELIKMMQSQTKPNWSDLELLLGESVDMFNSPAKLSAEKTYLENKLNDYLAEEQKRLIVPNTKFVKESMNRTIFKMIDSLGWRVEDNEKINVHFLTFNYTDTISRIIASVETKASKDEIITYYDPLYIHGNVNKCLILGVNSGKQCEGKRKIPVKIMLTDVAFKNGITTKNIAEEQEQICNYMIKPKINEAIRHEEVEKIKHILDESDKICIYGSSLGDTDKYWWEYIGDWLNKETCVKQHQLGAFVYYEEMNSASATGQLRIKAIEQRLKNLMNRTSSNSEEVNAMKEVVIVKKCEDWMFDFNSEKKDEGIVLSPERNFAGLIL